MSILKDVALFLLITFLFIGQVSAQQTKIDSLYQAIDGHPKNDSVKVDILLLLAAEQFKIGEREEAFKTDSLALKTSKSIDFKRGIASSYHKLGVHYQNISSYDIAIKCYDEAVDLWKEIGDKKGNANSHINLGSISIYRGDYDDAMEKLEFALRLQNEINDHEGKGPTLVNMGIVFEKKGLYSKSIEVYEEALIVFELTDYKIGQANIHNNLAIIYKKTGQSDKAINHYSLAKEYYSAGGSGGGVGRVLSNLGSFYLSLGNYPMAIENLQSALPFRKEAGDIRGLGFTHRILGTVFFEQENYKAALESYRLSLDIQNELKSISGIGRVLAFIGDVYKVQEKYNSALYYYNESLSQYNEIDHKIGFSEVNTKIGLTHLAQENYEEAQNYLRKVIHFITTETEDEGLIAKLGMARIFLHQNKLDSSLAYAKAIYDFGVKSGNKKTIRDASEVLSNIEENKGNHLQALAYYKIFTSMNDSLFNENNVRKITTLELQYAFDREKEVTKLEQEQEALVVQTQLRTKQTYIIAFAIGLVLTGLLSYSYYRLSRIRRKNNDILVLKNIQINKKNDELIEVISKLKKTQQQLLESEKLASMGILVSGLSHEINNPLNYIQGGVNLLSTKIDKSIIDDKPDLKKLFHIVNEGIDRVEKVLKGLSEASRVDDILKEEINVTELLENCISKIVQQHGEKVKIETDYQENTVIMGGSYEISQIFTKLLLNAIQSTQTDGTISIKTKSNASETVIEIKDDGIGIPVKEHKKIGTPFYTTKEPGSGMGLGLFIAYSLVNKYHGTIDFESEENKGTKFTVKFPQTNSEALVS